MVADLTAQALIAGVWTPLPILTEDGFTITRLAQNQASRVDAGSCRLTLRNPAGIYTSRNPRSPYYGKLGKNTQLRATVPDTTHLYLPGAGAWSATPDHSSLDITGDLDLRADIQPEVWDTTNGFGIADKYLTTGNQRSWAWYINYQRRPIFRWSPDGTIASAITVMSSAPVPVSGDGRTRLRVTLRPSFGGFYHVHFYVGDTLTGPWTLLGNGWVGTPSSLFAGTAQLRVGNDSAGALGLDPFIGRVHAFQMRSGLDGTIVANPDFTAQPVGTAPFADSAGRTWTPAGDAEVRDFDVRFHGEVARWPIRWNVSGKKLWAPLEASGILRRLSRPKSPLRSALYREATKATNLPMIVSYHPAEEETEALSISSGIGGPPMSATAGLVSFAAEQAFPGSVALPQLQAGATLKASIPSYTSTGVISFRCLANVPASGFLNGSPIAEVVQVSTGGITRWVLRTNVSGQLQLQGLANDGTVVLTSGLIGFDIRGKRQMLGFEVEQLGANVHWAIFSRTINPDLTVVEGGFDSTFVGAGTSIGRATTLIIGGDGDLTDGVFGHFMVGSSVSLADNFNAAMVGHAGELAGRRIRRLCAEQDVPLVIVGNASDTVAMGPQQIATLAENLVTAADADGGQLGEMRTSLALRYRTRVSAYNQTARLALTYGQGGESPHLEPEDLADDVVNDVTVSRTGGSSARAVDETSPLSVQDHPDGVGRYDVAEIREVATDAQLRDAAGWILHLGTWDAYRYPRIEIDYPKLVRNSKPDLAAAGAALDGLDRLTIENPPDWLPPDPIDQLMIGSTETIRPGIRTISLNCAPAGPWDIAVVDGPQRVIAEGTALTATFTDVAGSFTASGTSDWVTGNTGTNPTDFPLPVRVSAEVVMVSEISGSGTQTFTVSARGLNGYTATHPAATFVDVAEQAVAAH
ncbi:hypothetical protein [Actinoplanes sp. NPDC049599]|uniref:hypothetical protein n=1 Tax=Actinoplanes sp. NPDC049599 TaxID=3363903 RepID=UPI0037AA9663